MDQEIKALLEKQNNAFEAFKDANDKRLAAVEKNLGTGEKDAELKRINDALTEQGKDLREMNKQINRKGLTADAEDAAAADTPELKAYRNGFMNWLRTGNDAGLQEKAVAAKLPRNAVTTDSDANGGFIVDPLTVKRMSDIAGLVLAMRNMAEVVPAFLYEDSVEQHTSAAAWAAEKDSRSETTAPTWKEVRIEAEELYAEPRVTQKMLDIRPDAEGYVNEKVGTAIAELEGAAFILGSGVKKPRGILNYGTVANSSYAWGSVGYFATGNSGAFAASNPGDILIDVTMGLKPRYRKNGKWLMADLTQAAVRKLKDGQGNYLWKEPVLAGQTPTIMGYGVETDDNMPVIAANSLSIAFADWRTAYKIVDPGMMTILRDPFTAKPFIKLYTTKRVGGGIANFEAIKLLKFA